MIAITTLSLTLVHESDRAIRRYRRPVVDSQQGYRETDRECDRLGDHGQRHQGDGDRQREATQYFSDLPR